MKSINAFGAMAILATFSLISARAMAQENQWYLGLDAGQSRATIDDSRVESGLLGSGMSTTSITNDDRYSTFNIFGGLQLNRNFAIEGGYYDLGRFHFSADTLPAGNLRGSISLRGVDLDLVGILPFNDRFSAYGKVGVAYSRADDAYSGSGAVNVLDPDPHQSGANLQLGAGLQYMFNESFAARAEVDRYRVGDAVGNRGDIDTVTVGLVYRFGNKTPARPVALATPTPVAAAVPPPPPVVVTPPTPVVRPTMTRVNLSADSLFEFGKSDLTEQGRAALDRLAIDLRGVTLVSITITGHTDRIGAIAYNLHLSMRRASAVEAYMTTHMGIPESKIIASGVGMDDPVTKPADCPGQKVTTALISCLAPDRRVEIIVSGTK
jgi:OmpA-OmpF porin, OOP family